MAFIAVGLAACSAQRSAYVAPQAQLDPNGRYYVVMSMMDARYLHKTLAEDLAARNLNVSYGVDTAVPKDADVVVRYGGQWAWDMDWYLLDFQVSFHRAADDELLASAQTFRTSLARKPADEMVRMAVDQVFGVEDK